MMFEAGGLESTGPPTAVRLVVFDFDGVFTDNTVWTDRSGNEWVRSWRGDGLGIERLRDTGIPAFVLSTEVNEIVSRRCEKLGLPCRQGLADKAVALREVAAEMSVELDATVYVGNDINDLECLRLVGVPVVVADAHPDVVGAGRYRTRAAGGFGAVREVCDWIAGAAPLLKA